MFNEDLDLAKIMKSCAQMNPHIPHSEIAFLMDMPGEPEIDYEESFVFD